MALICELGLDTNAYRHVLSAVLAVGNISAGTDLQLPIDRRVLVNSEVHGLGGGSRLELLCGVGGAGRDGESERGFVDRGNLAGHGLSLWGSLFR